MFKVFTRITPAELAREHLHQAQMKLLEAQSEHEYWIGMVPVLKNRVERLNTILTQLDSQQASFMKDQENDKSVSVN